ncbi:MAG: hypothetical protein MN733_31185, partial [Nitrososphaera sp.]|nr:hypothetical protein [Nitrososphaera sp.]
MIDRAPIVEYVMQLKGTAMSSSKKPKRIMNSSEEAVGALNSASGSLAAPSCAEEDTRDFLNRLTDNMR